MLALMKHTHAHTGIQTHTQSMLAESDVETSTLSSTKEPKRLHFGNKRTDSVIETMNIKNIITP